MLSVKERLFVERSRALGAGGWHLVTRHVLPHTGPLILANAILTVPGAILAESTPAFLGFGDPFQPSWGKMLEGALSSGAISLDAWWYYWPPGCASWPWCWPSPWSAGPWSASSTPA